jgi:hypothetical protein
MFKRSGVEGECPFCGLIDLGYYSTVPQDNEDRSELIHIIETIPDIEISQLPGENFLN